MWLILNYNFIYTDKYIIYDGRILKKILVTQKFSIHVPKIKTVLIALCIREVNVIPML